MPNHQRTQPTELKVFITTGDSTCGECGQELGRQAWIILNEEKGALCLACADLDHLIFLPAGDAALTRRASKYSTLVAVVLKWSRARKRYERQGLLVEAQALEQAEQECLADSEARARRREREAIFCRAELDHHCSTSRLYSSRKGIKICSFRAVSIHLISRLALPKRSSTHKQANFVAPNS